MNDLIVSDLKQVATHFKRSERQVRRWMRAGAPHLSDGSYDLVLIRRWLKGRWQGNLSHKEPGYTYCRARLGELVDKSIEGRLLAGLADVELGLITISQVLSSSDSSEELGKVIIFFLQTLSRPLLKQIGEGSPQSAGMGSPFGSQVRLILE